jgi:hypothetical protein
MNTEPNKNANLDLPTARELTLLALCDVYLAAGLSAQHALLCAEADYACNFRISDNL